MKCSPFRAIFSKVCSRPSRIIRPTSVWGTPRAFQDILNRGPAGQWIDDGPAAVWISAQQIHRVTVKGEKKAAGRGGSVSYFFQKNHVCDNVASIRGHSSIVFPSHYVNSRRNNQRFNERIIFAGREVAKERALFSLSYARHCIMIILIIMNDKLSDMPKLRQKIRVFQDRQDAGRILADMLHEWKGSRAVVLAIPSGGIPVAVEVTGALNLTLDVAVVSKILLPWNTESGFGLSI